jgi:hypothetical protein
MEDLPISFSWIPPKVKADGNCITYCFAFIRDPKTHIVLHAGVKYFGKYSDLKKNRLSLRKTAIERLLKKPIYSSVCLGKTDDQYRTNLSNPKFNYNGIGKNGDIKKSNALSKFFLNLSFNKDIGLCCSKKDANFRYYKNDMKYVILKSNEKNENTVYVRYGYEYNGDELKKITSISQDNIFNLRKRGKFFGTKKNRIPFENYYDYTETDELKQYGISMVHIKKNINKKYVKLEKYHSDNRIIFYRVRLNQKTRLHIAFIDFYNWLDYVKDKLKYSIENIENSYNRYCIGYSVETISNQMNSRLLHKKIAIDRLIFRPNILNVPSLEKKKTYDARIWFSSHLNYLSIKGIGRINKIDVKNTKLKLACEYDDNDEKFGVYYSKNNKNSFFGMLCEFFNEMYNIEVYE